MHLQLVHIGFGKIKYLSLNGELLLKGAAALKRALKVVCLSCKFGKNSKRSDGADKTQPRYDKWIYIKKGYMFPGQRISVDHYVRALLGRLYICKGGPQEKYMLHCGMVLTNHAGRYVSTGRQVNLSYGEYMKSNLKYERCDTNYGVLVQAYHTENGVFTSKKFMEVIIGQV